jgi:hypothetical protein
MAAMISMSSLQSDRAASDVDGVSVDVAEGAFVIAVRLFKWE